MLILSLHRQTPECRIQQGCTVLILHNCRNCQNFILCHLFQAAYIDRAARMEVAKIEVRCDYCKTWSDKEENLQVILDNTRSCSNLLVIPHRVDLLFCTMDNIVRGAVCTDQPCTYASSV